ncbi:MAG: signal peptidase I [Ruminococcus sp.]|nr:signal peptidase I [Ruminococcus sp.]
MKSKLTKVLNVIVDVLVVCILIISVLILTMVLGTKGDDGVPSVFGKAPISVLSDSMKGDKDDDFSKGDLLLCDVVENKAEAEYKVGDVVTFKLRGIDIDKDEQDDFVTHRIYKVNKDGTFQTKGDANSTYDQDPKANAWQDVSKMDIVATYHGSKIGGLGDFIAYLQTSLGFFLIILLPMIIFFLYQAVRVVINIVAYNKEKTLKKAQEMIQNADLSEEQKQKAIEEYLAQQEKKEEPKPEEAPQAEEAEEQES